MLINRRLRRLVCGPVAFAAALMLFNGVANAGQTNNVGISQVYGGGGNSGATYKNDFIEIFNLTANTLSVAGYSVQYASSTGSSWQVTALPAVSLALENIC